MFPNLDRQLVAIVWLGGVMCTHACGPSFPNQLLEHGDLAVLQAPVADFGREIQRIAFANSRGQGNAWWYAHEARDADSVSEIDLRDLRRAMGYDPVGPGYATYAAVREAIASNTAWTRMPDPKSVPEEFALYLQGAVQWHLAETNAAVACWTRLLDLPPEIRRFRSTWAAFMLGKAALAQGQCPVALARFRQVRDLVRDRYDDSLGLAASSLGWEARAQLDLEHEAEALDLYLQQYVARDATALNSLRLVANSFWSLPPERLTALIKTPAVRDVMIAHALAYNGYDNAPAAEARAQLLDAIEHAGVPRVAQADRLAWAAYQIGAFDQARRFLAVAPAESEITVLLDAKLLLRDGREDEALEKLARIAHSFPPASTLQGPDYDFDTETWDLQNESLGTRVQGELGVLSLAREEFTQALDYLLRGGYWMDAAYVAERVLTTKELQHYVNENWSVADYAVTEAALTPTAWYAYFYPRTPGENIRYLLGRRLVRGGALTEARPYLPPVLRPLLDSYTAHLRAGRNPQKSKTQRATALWRAACITRYRGMELMGTELDPDWTFCDGDYSLTPVGEFRAAPAGLVSASSREQQRVKESAASPDVRFHYRRKAVALAWEAAGLMPDGAEETADVLCTAGGWLKEKDPVAAERFYQELVRRCGKTTSLGRAAATNHWFPRRDIDPEALLQVALQPGSTLE